MLCGSILILLSFKSIPFGKIAVKSPSTPIVRFVKLPKLSHGIGLSLRYESVLSSDEADT